MFHCTPVAIRQRLALFCALALLVLAWPTAASSTATEDNSVPPPGHAYVWELSDAKVLSTGRNSRIPQGEMTEDYVIEGSATANNKFTPISKGRFRINISVFSPSKDGPNQKAGVYYVQGDWAISAPDSDSKNSYSALRGGKGIKGSIQAELDFNPITTKGNLSALLRMPLSRCDGKWAKGEGTFTGNQRFEGTIYCELSRLITSDGHSVKKDKDND